MKISREQLASVAQATGHRPEILEKVIHLFSLLNGFQSHPFLRSRIALKGGTALNLFIFDVPRLSVDIDLNYIGSADREVMQEERPKLEQAIQAVSSREGMMATRIPSEHAGGKWRLRYASVVNESGTLAVDLNYMLRVPLWPVVMRSSRQIGSYQTNEIPVLDVHELTVGKLAALLSRHASRDLFDTHGLLRGGMELNPALLRIGFMVYGAMNRKDWRTVRVEDVDFDKNELHNELLSVLRLSDVERVGALDDWAERLVRECRESLAVVLPFTDKEREFLDRILDHGEIVAELLTNDADLIQRITSHPMLLWKAQNVRQYKNR